MSYAQGLDQSGLDSFQEKWNIIPVNAYFRYFITRRKEDSFAKSAKRKEFMSKTSREHYPEKRQKNIPLQVEAKTIERLESKRPKNRRVMAMEGLV